MVLGKFDGSHRIPSNIGVQKCDELQSEARLVFQPAELGVCIRTLGAAKAATYERRKSGASTVSEIFTTRTSRVELEL